MSTPERVRNYTYAVNNRSVFSSLNQVMSEYLFGIKNFLVATLGYTVKYSCNGTTGPSSAGDHTDRWITAANATTRGANTSSASSWIVLTDGDGVDFMLAYVGSTDDVGRYSYSLSALFTPAGTATFPATATDEHVVSTTGSWIDSTASADRVFHLLGTADKKTWRAWICRAGKAVGSFLGMETYSGSLVSPAVQSPGKVIVYQLASNLTTSSLFSTSIFFARITLSSVASNLSFLPTVELPNPSSVTALDGVLVELQGSVGGLCRSISAWATSGNGRGKLGNMIDWWHSAETRTDGALTPDKKWIQLTGSTSQIGGVLWPWDGSSEPQFT